MTENEVFEHISNLAGDYKCFNERITHQESLILYNLIEEIQQYRAIGTVEEIKSEHKELIKLSRRYLKDTDELIKYQEIGTVEELKDLKEKDTPYKPQEYEDRYYACKCDNILLPKWRKYPTELMPKSEGLPHCMACGQKLDWQ